MDEQMEKAAKLLHEFVNARTKFRDLVQQTLLIQANGFDSLAALIHYFIRDHGFDPRARARELGYFSFLECLKSWIMQDVVHLDYQLDGSIHFYGKTTNEGQAAIVQQIREGQIERTNRLKRNKSFPGGY